MGRFLVMHKSYCSAGLQNSSQTLLTLGNCCKFYYFQRSSKGSNTIIRKTFLGLNQGALLGCRCQPSGTGEELEAHRHFYRIPQGLRDPKIEFSIYFWFHNCKPNVLCKFYFKIFQGLESPAETLSTTPGKSSLCPWWSQEPGGSIITFIQPLKEADTGIAWMVNHNPPL